MNKLRRVLVVVASLSLLLSLSGVMAGGVAAKKPIKDTPVRHDSPNYNNGLALPFGKSEAGKLGQPPLGPAKVGSVKTWLGLDDELGRIYLKNYMLRGVGNHVEVWVATNLNFPAGDCRNDGVRNVITDDQVGYLIDQFDNNMYPIESDWWSTPPNRDGHKALLPSLIPNLPSSEYKGEGDNVVVLIDNVRDDNYYDTDNAHTKSYIAGFYYSVFDDYFNRTVMSIDSWDWIHRTGGDPPHQPTGDPCTSAPARPNLYEGVFAHEYQHLLHRYTDPDEVSWVNEGLSDFTEVLTGYAHLDRHVDEKGYDSHTQAILGWLQVFHPDWNPIPYTGPAGPENGLTAWGDQGDGEILADYGAAMIFMNFIDSHPGLDRDFFHAWQHNQANGIQGLNNALTAVGAGTDFQSLFNDNLISMLVDGYIDNGASVSGGSAAAFSNDATEATVMLRDASDSSMLNPEASATKGAPPWGPDYIDLGAGSGLSSIVFDGDDEFFYPDGPQWVVDGDGYFTNPDASGDNYGDNQDLSIAIDASAYAGQTLTFDHYYSTEQDWDFGFVQVSTDGGASWQSLACSGTTTNHDPGAISAVVSNLPGYSGADGTAGAPVSVTCPALPAGTDYLAFRLITDPAVEFDGWHVRNIQLDGSPPAGWDNIDNWDNVLFFSPVPLDFGFALVGINGTVDQYGDVTAGDAVQVIRPTLGAGGTYTADAGDLAALSGYDTVVAIVWGIPADESSTLYQPYSLLVNGSQMADGGF